LKDGDRPTPTPAGDHDWDKVVKRITRIFERAGLDAVVYFQERIAAGVTVPDHVKARVFSAVDVDVDHHTFLKYAGNMVISVADEIPPDPNLAPTAIVRMKTPRGRA
jgi:hypothetical protein